MDQSEFEARLTGLNLTPDAGKKRTFVVDETATGADEVYDTWGGGPESGWLLLVSRYGQMNEPLCRAVRVWLARGATCVVTTTPAEIDASGNVVDGTLVCSPIALRDAARRTLEILATREAEVNEAIKKAES